MTLYSTGCPKCNILKKKLDQSNVEYDVCDDVDKMISLGMTTAPMLEVDQGKFMTFEEAFKYVSELGRKDS